MRDIVRKATLYSICKDFSRNTFNYVVSERSCPPESHLEGAIPGLRLGQSGLGELFPGRWTPQAVRTC